MDSEIRGLTVVMFPWLAHGHLTPFLELAERLSERNFSCYICSTKAILDSIIHERIAGTIELHLQTCRELPDPEHHTAKGLPFHLHKALRKALRTSKEEFSGILKNLKPDLLIHDVLVPWAGPVAKRSNVATVRFNTSGAVSLSYFVHLGRCPGEEYPFPAIKLTEFQLSVLLSNLKETGSEENELKDPEDDIQADWRNDGILLMNSTSAMEGKYMGYASQLFKGKVVPTGAMVRDTKSESDEGLDRHGSELMGWLGSKDELSSVLVSFGTNCFLNREEIQEIAYGLEQSKVNFVWIIGFPRGDGTKAHDALPEGFFERVGDKGRVVEKWAPQARILSHSSVGGFVSHCGWNSLMEGLEFTVPIIGVPMHLDQPMNAKVVAELGYGVEVQRDGEGRLQREEIAQVIRDVVLGEKGRDLRNRAAELREEVRMKSGEEFQGVVEALEGLCVVNRALASY